MKKLTVFCAFTALCLSAIAAPLSLNKGDHICIIGNVLADRMQHSGYLESLIYAKFPDQDLVFRNLGFSGDEITVRLRSEAFGSPDDWLSKEKADVIFAFFGYNESYKGYDGLQKFRSDLEKLIKDTLKQDYSGKGDPRIVLFSPIAQEKHPDPNFIDPAAHNANIKDYASAMADVAKANGVQFVDLFTASQESYGQAKEPLTINTLHLNDAGYKALAPSMYQALFDEPAPAMNNPAFQKLVSAVHEQNE